MTTLDRSDPVTYEAFGPPTRIVNPPTMAGQKFVYWGDTFRAYLLDGRPYNMNLSKQKRFYLRNAGESQCTPP